MGKSVVCFIPNISEKAKRFARDILDIPQVNCHEKYLRLPIMTGKKILCPRLVKLFLLSLLLKQFYLIF